MNFITIDEALNSVLTLDRNHTREDRLIYKFWIWRAVRDIGCPKATLKTVVLDLENNSVKKPEDHLHTKDLALIGFDGLDYTYKYKGYNARIHPKTPVNDPISLEVYEDPYCFHLNSEATNIDKINLSYWAYPTDENGDPLIPDHYLYPVMRFCSLMKAERDGDSLGKIQIFMQEWKIQAAKARGKNNMPNIPEARDIMKGWMSMIPKMSNLDYNTY
jgi:hypothetical protein